MQTKTLATRCLDETRRLLDGALEQWVWTELEKKVGWKLKTMDGGEENGLLGHREKKNGEGDAHETRKKLK